MKNRYPLVMWPPVGGEPPSPTPSPPPPQPQPRPRPLYFSSITENKESHMFYLLPNKHNVNVLPSSDKLAILFIIFDDCEKRMIDVCVQRTIFNYYVSLTTSPIQNEKGPTMMGKNPPLIIRKNPIIYEKRKPHIIIEQKLLLQAKKLRVVSGNEFSILYTEIRNIPFELLSVVMNNNILQQQLFLSSKSQTNININHRQQKIIH
ncbi:hypothetical protein BDC45DRAFT_591085 [Circinella umbellata]|nr:hypothetical protein BDC45DRAFT_591085 [Circinella umbellata]